MKNSIIAFALASSLGAAQGAESTPQLVPPSIEYIGVPIFLAVCEKSDLKAFLSLTLMTDGATFDAHIRQQHNPSAKASGRDGLRSHETPYYQSLSSREQFEQVSRIKAAYVDVLKKDLPSSATGSAHEIFSAAQEKVDSVAVEFARQNKWSIVSMVVDGEEYKGSEPIPCPTNMVDFVLP
ncbi:MAG: hypothetical protein LRY39_01510 [Alphaproteobacteria bacterium]|nr:hypothetical protein [Alphaproteobacteria bacterium]